jgi:hypothetical protein
MVVKVDKHGKAADTLVESVLLRGRLLRVQLAIMKDRIRKLEHNARCNG